jgi:hypothetical protein
VSECAYSVAHYRDILRAAQARYWLPLVRDVARRRPTRDFLLIRHDVDLHPWAALAMAELEKEEGVATTYYFRLHAPYYNLLDGRVAEIVRAIAAMGHEVGLHYEPGFFLARGEDPIAGTRRDIEVFEAVLGAPTATIAQHQPAQGPVLGVVSERHPCAYERDLVHDIPYFGDSGHHWREGCICTKLGHLPRIHVLIHPHAWMSEGPWRERLRAWSADLGRRLATEMEAYIGEVERYLEQRAQLDRERRARYEP